MDLEKEHKGTLGYLGMTTQLASENRLYFKAGLKRVTNCMRSNGITSNVRRKKRNRIKRREEYINDNLLKGQFDRKGKNEVWPDVCQRAEILQHPTNCPCLETKNVVEKTPCLPLPTTWIPMI